MKSPWYTLVKKEWRTFVDHPTAYVLLVVFLAANFFFFFHTALLNGEASMRPLFDLLPWFLMFFVPAVTMRAVAEEEKEGTWELLTTQPVRLGEILGAKILGCWLFVASAILLTFPAVIGIARGGALDLGVVFGQYLGALSMAAGLTAVGVFASAVTKHQVIAFIVGIGVAFFLVIAGFPVVTLSLPYPLNVGFQHLSILTHFQNMARGVLDVRDLVYFVSLIAVFAFATYLLLERKRVPRTSASYLRLKVGTAIVVALAIAINLTGGFIPGRFDFTDAKIYTLTDATKQTVAHLPDVVTLTLYVSQKLPAQVALTARDVRDLLNDYERAGWNALRVEVTTLDGSEAAAQRAQEAGIAPVRFNVIQQDAYQVQQGFLGLTISYLDQHEVIPFIQQTGDLEYQITRTIHRLTTADRKTVAFLQGHGEKSLYQDLGALQQELSKQYTVEPLPLSDTSPTIPDDVDVVVIVGATQTLSDADKIALEAFLSRGGSLFLAASAVTVEPTTFQAFATQSNAGAIAQALGVTINSDLVMDYQSNERVSFGGGFVSFILPYPLWPRALAVAEQELLGNLTSIALPWTSSLALAASDDTRTIKPLFTTTPYASVQSGGAYVLDPQKLPQPVDDQFRTLPLAALVEGTLVSGGVQGRAIVVGSAEFLGGQFVQNDPQGVAFVLNSIDWLAQDASLAGLRARQVQQRNLLYQSDVERQIVKYVNFVGVPFVIALGGMLHLFRRRQKTRRIYTSSYEN